MKDLYLLKYEQNERDKDALLQNNNNMKDMLLRNKSEIDQLKLDNDNLIKKEI